MIQRWPLKAEGKQFKSSKSGSGEVWADGVGSRRGGSLSLPRSLSRSADKKKYLR